MYNIKNVLFRAVSAVKSVKSMEEKDVVAAIAAGMSIEGVKKLYEKALEHCKQNNQDDTAPQQSQSQKPQ